MCGMIIALATLFGYFRMLDQNSLVVAGVGSALGLYLLRFIFNFTIFDHSLKLGEDRGW